MSKYTTISIAIAMALAAPLAHAQTSTTTSITSEAQYMTRVAPRYETFIGSTDNTQSLVHGLRTGSQVTLAGDPGTDSVIFTPSTRPMGYGNITRTLDLAQRQLAAVGITNPTPRELDAALNGGVIMTANGEASMSGILQLRSQGMGWGKIAHTVGVHPGMGKGVTNAASSSVTTSSVTTAAGTNSVTTTRTNPNGRAVGQGVTTAAGAGGQGYVASGKGITTAGGAGVSHGQGHARAGGTSSIVTGAGSAAGAGITTAGGGGNGRGNAYGRGGKN